MLALALDSACLLKLILSKSLGGPEVGLPEVGSLEVSFPKIKPFIPFPKYKQPELRFCALLTDGVKEVRFELTSVEQKGRGQQFRP